MKKIIYFITLLFLVGCVDLSENMYNLLQIKYIPGIHRT